MSAPDDLSLASAPELVAAYRSGAASPVEATRAALDAVDDHDRQVNAFVLVDEHRALAAATASQRRWREGRPLGPVDGVPTSVKDMFLTEGWPTLRGSRLLDADQDWPVDSPAVARLREAGAVLLGKTAMPEFAWKAVTDSPRHGTTRNPWDPALTPGGSSGGSAAAVALGMGTWSIGSDGAGSVRIPAAFTGTVALKPTYGLVPMFPSSPFGTLSHGGPMTRSVVEAALLLDVVSGPDPRDWSAMPPPSRPLADGLDGLEGDEPLAGLRVAFSPTLGHGRNHPDVDAAVRAAVAVLVEAGARVEEVDPGFDDPVEALHVLWFSGAAKVLQGYDAQELTLVEPALLEHVRAASYSALDYLDATAVRMELGRLMGEFHTRFDVLVTPTMPIPAFPADRPAPAGWPSQLWTSWTPYTYPFNLTQQPALSVPCGFTADGLPVGLQVVGPRHADRLVLRVGRAYERAAGWSGRRPPLLRHEGEPPTTTERQGP